MLQVLLKAMMHSVMAINKTKLPISKECNKVIVSFARRERSARPPLTSLSTVDYCSMRVARKRHPGARCRNHIHVHVRHSNAEADVAVYL